jgi:TPR repeat protein
MNPRAPLLSSIPLALALFGCGPSAKQAQAYLESQGMTDVTVTKNGNAFDFVAKSGADVCTGTVSISKGFGTTNTSLSKSCKLDTRSCKPGAAAECVRLADQLYAREAKVFPNLAADLYRTACADKDGHSCGRLAEFEAIDKTWDKVRSYGQQGCDLDDADACTRLGMTELKGEGGPKDEAKALEHLKKGCSKGSMPGCRAVAGTLLDKTPADNAGARPFAEKICAAKYGDGCIVEGLLLFNTKEYAKALPLLEAGCPETGQSTRGLACNLAGAIYFDGLVGKKDLPRGLDLFEKACAADNEDGCTNAARSYARGLGVARDPAKAKSFEAKACKARGGKDCPPT